MNKVILQGNLGKDPDLRYTPSGTAVCTCSLATVSRYKDRNGDKQEKTTWHNLVVWSGLAEVLGKYGCKGMKVLVCGEIENRSYDDRDGNKKYVSEVIVKELEMLSQGKAQGEGGNQPAGQQQPGTFAPDDDIPF